MPETPEGVITSNNYHKNQKLKATVETTVDKEFDDKRYIQHVKLDDSAGNVSKVIITDGTDDANINSNGGLHITSYHEDGTEGALISGINWVSGKSGIDSATETLQIIDYEHHEIHGGSHYIVSDVATLSLNEVYDIQFTTPNTTTWTHFVFKLDCEAETEWYIYEGATIINAGTTITPRNNNRNSSNTSSNTLASQLNTSVANANADTSVAGATEIEHGIVGAGRTSGGSDSRNRELIFKQNTVYCLRAIANAAGYIDFLMNWYEHSNKN